MAQTTHRINAAPRSAVLYVYDPNTEVPAPVEPAPDSLVVILPVDLADLDAIKAFVREAATVMKLSLPRDLT